MGKVRVILLLLQVSSSGSDVKKYYIDLMRATATILMVAFVFWDLNHFSYVRKGLANSFLERTKSSNSKLLLVFSRCQSGVYLSRWNIS